MTIGIYDTAVLTRTVNSLVVPGTFLLDNMFRAVQTEDSEEIHFDLEETELRLAPFVAPYVEGQVVEDLGFQTRSFRPAYVKDKRRLRPQEPLKRVMGEGLTGTLSPAERSRRLLAQKLRSQRIMMDKREEAMVAEFLTTGSITITGEKYPTVVVDFLRDPALTLVLAGGSQWGDAGVSPVNDLEDWVFLVQEKSGASANVIIMDKEAFKLCRADTEFKELLDTRRGSNSRMELAPQVPGQGNAKALYKGMLGDLEIWVYNDVYKDDAGATQQLLPPNTVLVVDPDALLGTRCYATIQDEEANYSSERFFTKSWLEKDPAVRWLLSQSAPLTVPYRPNASMAITVK